jgi:hypothetical protein
MHAKATSLKSMSQLDAEVYYLCQLQSERETEMEQELQQDLEAACRARIQEADEYLQNVVDFEVYTAMNLMNKSEN